MPLCIWRERNPKRLFESLRSGTARAGEVSNLSIPTSQEILELIRRQLSEILDEDQLPPEIHLSSSLNDDLGLGSLEAVSWIMNLEDELDVELSDDEVAGLRVVGDVVQVIEKKLAERLSGNPREAGEAS